MNVSTLKTLDDRQYYSGMGEDLKHGLIKSARFYEWIIDNMYEIHERNLETLEDMVYKSCTCKKLVVETCSDVDDPNPAYTSTIDAENEWYVKNHQ